MKTKKFRLLHLLIAAVAVINLVFLFVFHYGLSNATPAVQAATRAAEARAAYDAETGFNTQENGTEAGAVIVTSGSAENVEEGTEDMSFDDISEAELIESETTEEIEAAAESDADTNIKSLVKPANSSAEDELSASNESEQAASKSPVITLASDLPTVDYDDLKQLVTIFRDLGVLSADDGYGTDISSQITAEYEEVGEDSSEYRITFSVTNLAGNTTTEECTITVEAGDHPVLELTTESVTIDLYDSFNYMSYIKTAKDVDGSSLDESISLNGYVDTDTPGTYEVTYSVVSFINSERVERTLTVEVSED